MKNTIIVHGKPTKEQYYAPEDNSSSNFAWIPWLQKQLIVRDIKTDTPEMPHSYRPDYSVWKREFERFDITPETTLVGHSMGAGFLVRWLSEHTEERVDKVILVAPSLDPLKQSETGFCDFEIDTELCKRTNSLVVMTSDNDSDKAEMTIDIIKNSIPDAEIKMYPGYGHFIPDHLGKETLEELLEEILK